MKTFTIYRLRLIFQAVLLASLAGCTLEQKLAKTFIEEGIHDDFLLMKPDFVYKYNLKEYEIPGIDSLDEMTKDSLLVENSLFLKQIDDSRILDNFTASFLKAFKTYGISIFPENYLDTFLVAGSKASIINIAQFSMEEYVHPFSTEEVIYDEIIVIDDIDLNAVNFNAWIEMSLLNSEGESKVLFATDYLLDDLEGTLKQYLFTGQMTYDFTIDTITTAGIYDFAGRFGATTAAYLYDYMLNQYIARHIPPDYPFERYYYHYDPVKDRAYPIDPAESLIEVQK